MEKMPENAEKYVCEKCHFKCCKKSNYDKHLSTPKHVKLMSVNEQLIQNTQLFICQICSKEYKSNVGLWKHKKTCINIPVQIIEKNSENTGVIQLLIDENKELINENKELINDNKDFKNLILEMMKSNTDLQKQMLEVCKNSNTTINNTKTKKTGGIFFNLRKS